MCGINGIVDYKASIDDSIVHAMNDSLAHRGPDGEGIFTSRTRNVALGNRRLSIVDIDNGSQPVVVTHNGYEFAITYNGEVYNHKELRHELESRGYKFKTNSDTEVVLNAYVEFGERCVDRFNGQFAFAIYDGKKDSVYLARDKFGIKPLYYANVNGALVFSSEPKGILTHPNFNAKPNLETIADFFLTMDIFTDGHISLNRTFFDGIHALEPGMYCVVDRNGSEIQRYWDVNIHTDNPDEITEELIRNAVSIRIPDEVRVGTALSGGLDSSIVTYLTLQQGHQLPAATVKYNGVKYNPDWDHAQLFADEFGVENLCVGLDANTLLDDIHPLL